MVQRQIELIKMDDLAQKDFRLHMTQAECFRYRRNWWIALNNDRTSGRLKYRSDFNEALSTLHHQHQESGERQLRPVPFWKYQERQPSSSSSSTWWQWSGSWRSSQEIQRKSMKEDGQGDGVPKASPQQAAEDSRGSRTCVCANTFSDLEWHNAGGEG